MKKKIIDTDTHIYICIYIGTGNRHTIRRNIALLKIEKKEIFGLNKMRTPVGRHVCYVLIHKVKIIRIEQVNVLFQLLQESIKKNIIHQIYIYL